MSISPELDQEVRRLLVSGKSERTIADLLKISRRQVANIKKKMDEDKGDNPLASDIGPTMKRPAAIAELVLLSTRPEGVRRSETWPVLRGLFGMQTTDIPGQLELAMTENQWAYLKKQTVESAAAQGKVALFLPEWLSRQAPVQANEMLVSMAGWLHDRAQEYVSDLLAHFPDISGKHVFTELHRLAFPPPQGEPIQTKCQRNAETAELLQSRLGNRPHSPTPHEPLPYDAELDTLCI